jgi:hypothetical protein
MTRALKSAIETLIQSLENETFGRKSETEKNLQSLKDAYENHKKSMTVTAERIEYLEECLEDGISKREAARRLVLHDPRIGQRTAETLVYMNFSGQYQTTTRGRRKSKSKDIRPALVISTSDITDDESLL